MCVVVWLVVLWRLVYSYRVYHLEVTEFNLP